MRIKQVVRHVLLAIGLSVCGVATERGVSSALSTTAPAQSVAATKPTAQGTLQQRLDRLCVELEKQRESLHIPGFAIAIVKDDKVILSKGFGLRDVEHNTPVTPETLFAIGSSSKAFTAALVAMLIDEGKMSLDDPVRKHLPEFHLFDKEADEKITIRDLLCHRCGLERTDLVWASGLASREEILAAIATAEPTAKFREKFQYQNVMFMAAGMAAANAAGLKGDWDALVAQRIFTPLGMAHTNTTVKAAQENPQLSLGYSWKEDKKEYKHLPMRDLRPIAPAGAINSNVIDMVQWLRLQLNKGEVDGQRLIKAERFDEMRSKQIAMAEGAGLDYGLGWMLHDWQGKKVVEHGGNIDGFGAQVTLVPEAKLGYVLLTNVTATPLQGMSIGLVCDALLGEWKEHPDAPLDPTTVKDYLGKYHMDVLKNDVNVLMKDGKLAVDVPGQMVFTLKQPDAAKGDGKWEFEMTDQIAVSFERDATGGANTLKFHQSGLIFECPRVGYTPPLEISLDAAQKFLGTYHSDELSVDYKTLHRNGRLALDVPKQLVYDLRLPDKDGKWVFRATDKIAIKFDEDAGGAVTSLTMYQDGKEIHMPRTAATAGGKIPSVDEVLALHARGHGTDHLASLGTTCITAKFRLVNEGVSGNITTWCEGVERMRHETDMGKFGWIRIFSDGKNGWTRSIFSPGDDFSGKEAREAMFQNPLLIAADWKSLFSKIEIARLDKIGNRDVIVIDLTMDDVRCSAFIDSQTGRTAKFVYSTTVEGLGPVEATETFDDYRETAGVWLPFRATVESAIQGKATMDYDKVEPHATLPKDAFIAPKE